MRCPSRALPVGEGAAPGALGRGFTGHGSSCRTPMSMPARTGAVRRAAAARTRPKRRRRTDREPARGLAGSNGAAVAITLRARARTSAIGAASLVARAVGTTPLGVLRNSGSLSRRRSRPSPWLTADGGQACDRPPGPTWRSSSTASKSTRRFRSARARSISFSISLKSYHWIQQCQTAISAAEPEQGSRTPLAVANSIQPC